MTVQEIATWLHGEVVGNGSARIERVAKIEEADQQCISFLANPKYERYLETTHAAAVLVSKTMARLPGRHDLALIRVDDPYRAFLQVLKKLTPTVDPFPTGIHPSAVIAESASLGTNVAVGANAVVGENVVIGDNTKVSHGCVIGTGAVLGTDCRLYPNVTVYHQCRIGNRTTFHAGVVIGGDGFGFAPGSDGKYEKIPQLGIVAIGDDVEVGANSTIDRATMGETVIGNGVKIDNLVQIAHNCVIGDHTVIAAQTGIAGSVKIGKGCMIGGQVGIAGHLEIADRVVILAQTGISKSLDKPGAMYFGTPAKERGHAHRIEAVLRKLPELDKEVFQLRRDLERMMNELAASKKS